MSNLSIRFLSAADIRKLIDLDKAIELVESAFIQLSAGVAKTPLRTPLEMPEFSARTLVMPAYLPESGCYGIKTVSINDNNARKGLPRIHALVTVFSADTGQPIGVLDGEYLTALRTGAASALATRLMAEPTASVLALFGAGAQGRTQVLAVARVRPLTQIIIFDPTPQKAQQLAEHLQKEIGVPVNPLPDISDLSSAGIICTATSSTRPVFPAKVLRPGVHINAVGGYKPAMCEIPFETTAKARLVVDQREACLAEAGELLQPMAAGLIKKDHIFAEIGEIASGKIRFARRDSEITLFKSVGSAAQDLVVADYLLQTAAEQNAGSVVEI